MASDLTPSEKEDREAERLIHKRPPPSRKRTERRGPKHDNRRRRVKEFDEDTDRPDKDTQRDPRKGLSFMFDRVAQFICSEATSYETYLNKIMPGRTATYHGVVQQGHPSGPTTTGYKSLDKRYFGNDHFESILKHARELLDEDWIKYGWDNGAPDAQFRAALDYSIQLADDNLYQSKIDSETYDMLLNRLAKWEHDSFSETVYPVDKKNKRSASAMANEHLRNIIRIASDLRNSDPKMALDILKSVRSLVSSEAAPAVSISKIAQQEQEQEQGGHTSQEQQGDEEPGSVPDFIKEKSGQEQQSQQQDQGQQEQHSNDPDVIEFSPIKDEDLDKLKQESKKLFDAKDVDSFMEAFEALHEQMGQKTASVQVPLALLIRMASSNPAIRPSLMPILVAAKKKMDKKKDSKTSQQEQAKKKKKKGKKPPFGGKGAPPFGGKKAPPFGKKASINIGQEDFDW